MKQTIILTLIVFFIICLFPTYAQAKTFTLETQLDRNIFQEGELIKIRLKVKDILKTSDGITAVSGYFKIDEECFKIKAVAGLNNWTVILNEEENSESKGKFVIITLAGSVVKDTEIAEVILEVKRNLISQKTNIGIEDIKTSYNNDLVTAENRNIEVEIIGTKLSTGQIILLKSSTVFLIGLGVISMIVFIILVAFKVKIVKKK